MAADLPTAVDDSYGMVIRTAGICLMKPWRGAFAGQKVGIREVCEKIWLVSFMH